MEKLPVIQREFSHAVEAHSRAVMAELHDLQNGGEGAARPRSRTASQRNPAHGNAASMLRPGSIISGCNALLTELFRRNDELAEQCPEELFGTFAALLNAAGGRDPAVASSFLGFFESTVVQENGEPQKRNQAASLLALTDTRFTYITPKFTAERDVSISVTYLRLRALR